MDAVKPTQGGRKVSFRSVADAEEKDDRFHPRETVVVSNANTKSGGQNEAVDARPLRRIRWTIGGVPPGWF